MSRKLIEGYDIGDIPRGGHSVVGVYHTYAQKILAMSGIIGYWRMEEESGAVLDSSGRGNNGAVVGTPTRNETGKVGKCYTLDGSNNCVDIYSVGLNTAFNNQEITVAAWINLGTVDTTTRGIVRLRASATDLLGINKGNGNQTLVFTYTANSVQSLVLDTNNALNAWVHVAMTVSKSGDAMKAFINGAQTGTTQTGLGVWSGALSDTACVIGALLNSPANVWLGQIDEVVVANRAFTDAEILKLATV